MPLHLYSKSGYFNILMITGWKCLWGRVFGNGCLTIIKYLQWRLIFDFIWFKQPQKWTYDLLCGGQGQPKSLFPQSRVALIRYEKPSTIKSDASRAEKEIYHVNNRGHKLNFLCVVIQLQGFLTVLAEAAVDSIHGVNLDRCLPGEGLREAVELSRNLALSTFNFPPPPSHLYIYNHVALVSLEQKSKKKNKNKKIFSFCHSPGGIIVNSDHLVQESTARAFPNNSTPTDSLERVCYSTGKENGSRISSSKVGVFLLQ